MDSTPDREHKPLSAGNTCVFKKISDMNGQVHNQNNAIDQSLQSHQASPSFLSNYSIIEMENESCSTLKLYSTGHNALDQDLSIAAHSLTTKLH
jgi:hypothetical protein